MLRAVRYSGIALLLISAGCNREQAYLDVAREQRASWKELTDILATVKDEKSMASAKTALEKQNAKYEALAKKARSLPRPPPPEVNQRLQEDEGLIRATLRHLHTEAERVGKLPGGEEFLKQFKSESHGLMPAVQP
jgi:hypothetical protein